MVQAQVSQSAGDQASMLADLAHLTPDPAGLASLLSALGYAPVTYGSGLYAPALAAPGAELPVLLFPLYTGAGLSIRKGELVGRHVIRSGTVVAGLAALRSTDRRPGLLFLSERQAPPAGVRPDQVVSLEGGVVPRIWRRCFGRFDVLVRVTGQASHPGMTNMAVNAIETAVPILQALLHLKADLQSRPTRWGNFADAPLQPRLTISAAHGGSSGSELPSVFDVLATRRYDPAENAETAFEEIRSVITAATSRRLRVALSMTHHDTPVPDPDEPNRDRQDRALAAGWGWPQIRFSSTSRLLPGAVVLGGLERPDHDAGSDATFTNLDAMSALARTIRSLLVDG